MKSKVTAIKFSFAIVLISLWIYKECQRDFYGGYLILKILKYIFKAIIKNRTLYQWAAGIYAWLLKMPGPGGTRIIEMAASGIFGSAIVTGLIYVVEYRVQLRESINKLIVLQRNHIKMMNDITYISAFLDDPDNVKREAYLEYAENSSKLRGKEELEDRLKKQRELSNKQRKEILERNSQRLFSFKHEADQKYKEWIWNRTSDEEKSRVLEYQGKETYLGDALRTLFYRTDFELIAAFYDYQEIYLKDIIEIEQLTDEIYFLNMKKKRIMKDKIVRDGIVFDKRSNGLIKQNLEGFFECNDMKDSLRRSRKLLLGRIESLQEYFYGENLKEIEPIMFFDKWYSDIKQNVLKDNYEKMNFDKPKNKFMISSDGAEIPYEFSRKSRVQGWDYTMYIPFIQNEEYLKKMGYK